MISNKKRSVAPKPPPPKPVMHAIATGHLAPRWGHWVTFIDWQAVMARGMSDCGKPKPPKRAYGWALG